MPSSSPVALPPRPATLERALTTPDSPIGPEQFVVDLAELTGPVHGGATGMLYGLSDDGVPASALIAGARPHTVAQKAPDGLQHPTGDALLTASSFFGNGGQDLLVYMQDVYAQWPYEDLGIADFLAKVDVMVTKASASRYAERLHWVPFNEPDWIWYADWAADRERFCADWAAVHRAIRAVLPTAVIVGPNLMDYDRERMGDFLGWARDQGVLPDVVSWHELRPPSLSSYPGNYADYRDLEASLGIAALPININEYASRRDISNPGRMVQWISMFEATKVDADIAYWTYAGNLDDHAVQTSQANAGWWLLTWYADLTGQTVASGPTRPCIPGLRGLAALDVARAQATVLLGGTASEVALEITGIEASVFGDTVDVAVSRTSWAGYEGDAGSPPVVSRHRLPVVDGRVSVAVGDGDLTAAYRVVLTPVELDEPAEPAPRTGRYEAAEATLTDVPLVTETDDPDEYFISGGSYAGAMTEPTSVATFEVTVPADGVYRCGIVYGTAGSPAQQALWVDGVRLTTLAYPATLNITYRGRLDVPVELEAGEHSLSIRTDALPDSAVSINRLDLTGPVGVESSRYPARVARLSDGARLRVGSPDRAAAVVLREAALATVFVAAAEDGYYDLSTVFEVSATGGVAVSVDDRPVQTADVDETGRWRATVRVHLAHGISAVRLRACAGGAVVQELSLLRVAAADAATTCVPAAALTLAGSAELVADPYAYQGFYVSGLGQGGALSIARSGPAGPYNLTVGYANAEKNSAHLYNTDVISRRAVISEDGGTEVGQWFRHNYAWNNFWTLVVPLDLVTADGALRIGNPQGAAPNVDRLALSPLVVAETVELLGP